MEIQKGQSSKKEVEVTVFRCRFMNGGKCLYPGELPTGAYEDYSTRRRCRISAGARLNLEKCDIGNEPENVQEQVITGTLIGNVLT